MAAARASFAQLGFERICPRSEGLAAPLQQRQDVGGEVRQLVALGVQGGGSIVDATANTTAAEAYLCEPK